MFDVEILLRRLDEFTAFARKRLHDPGLAAEAVQEAFAKALVHSDDLADGERLVAWFYRILRNAITDLHRTRRLTPLNPADDAIATAESEAVACHCVASLLGELSPDYAQALRAVELEGASIEQAATAAGITVANLKVRRHRAKERLRELVDHTCRVCATHGCLDCTCRVTGADAAH